MPVVPPRSAFQAAAVVVPVRDEVGTPGVDALDDAPEAVPVPMPVFPLSFSNAATNAWAFAIDTTRRRCDGAITMPIRVALVVAGHCNGTGQRSSSHNASKLDADLLWNDVRRKRCWTISTDSRLPRFITNLLVAVVNAIAVGRLVGACRC